MSTNEFSFTTEEVSFLDVQREENVHCFDMSLIKPNKPGTYGGKRDHFTIYAWLYQFEQYLDLVSLGPPPVTLNDTIKIKFASTYL